MTEARTVGDILRAARRRRRVSIERAADETRIRADYLMRMESDEFDFLAPAYVRGFLRSYARWLGLEPSPLVADFDRRFGVGRTDTGQIAALERRGRNVARQRKRPSSWAVAATLAAIVMVALGVIGYTSNPSGQAPGQDEIAGLGDSASPEPTEEPTSEPTPRATPTRSPKDNVIAFTDGIRLQVVASRAECWVDVTADGAGVYAQVLGVGQRAGPFSAETSMDIVLGNAYGVDLIVNGRKVPGPFGPSGDVVTISLPEDIRSLL